MNERTKPSEKKESTNGSPRTDSTKIQPQSYEAEQSVLGAVLVDTTAFSKIVDYVHEDSFYWPKHKFVYQVMQDLFNNNEPIDLITVTQALRSREQLEDVGGDLYLDELQDATPFPSNVEFYAKLVQEKYVLRTIFTVSNETAEKVYDPDAEPETVLDGAIASFFDLQKYRDRHAYRAFKDIGHETMEELDRISQRSGQLTGITSGFKALDKLTGGFQASDLIILAARPSMGKTALALSFALNAAIHSKLPIGIVSLEMSAKQIAMRMISGYSKVPLWKVRQANWSKEEGRRVANAVGKLSELPIYIDDTAYQTVTDVRARAKRLKMTYGCEMIVFDYLQLMQPPNRVESQQQFIATVSRQLKGLAKELDLPVIALSQLSRAVETRGGSKKPILSDLRDSGAIEQDADVVMFVYRQAYYDRLENKAEEELDNTSEVIIGKQRNGPTGVAELTFLPEFAAFTDKEGIFSDEDVPMETGTTESPF
jgi:replicative DNA helicase